MATWLPVALVWWLARTGEGVDAATRPPPACTKGRATRWRHWEAHIGRGGVRRLPFRAAFLLLLMAGGGDQLRVAVASPSPPTRF